VRCGLPERFGVPGALPREDLFYAWRGFFNRLPGPDPQSMYNLYFGHQGRKGLSWVITNPGSMDVLVGNMGRPLPETELAGALADLRASNPLVGDRLLRGGGRQPPIPVRRPLGLIVANGYAAVGDSACMADPFSGCGICAAMEQGKLLAAILLECDGDYTLPKLWAYQYRTFTEMKAERRAATEAMRCVMAGLRPKEMDLLFTRGIIRMRGGVHGMKDALRLLRNIDHPLLLWKLAKMPARGNAIRAVIRRIPKTYEPAAVAAWARDYEGCKMC
jgi:flavin-dependent dehydrogenase